MTTETEAAGSEGSNESRRSSTADRNSGFAAEVERDTKIPLKLLAAPFHDSISAVRLIVNNAAFEPPPGYASQDSYIGHDGNKYFCQVCKELGEIVCCDGCPRAFHPTCLPVNGESHLSLLRDDDPWFCPVCWGTKEGRLNVCTPLVIYNVDKGQGHVNNNERYGNAGDNNHSGDGAESMQGNAESLMSDCDLDPPNHKRKRHTQATSPKPSPETKTNTEDKLTKKSRKDEKKPTRLGNSRTNSIDERTVSNASSIPPQRTSPRQAQAHSDSMLDAIRNRSETHVYFYLCEIRWKVERALAKSHRYFNRLSKGDERNALVAKEAATWWSELPYNEQKRFIDMSMQEYEQRIIEWKEDQNSNGMMGGSLEELESVEDTEEDEKQRELLHERLYRSTSIGHKSFSKESDQYYNEVLLGVLNNLRQESVQMFSVHRSEEELHHTRISVPVHGPIATMAGDECKGCTRGWAHHCPVVKYRLPAVEQRARVQTGVSSLMATRVGLGLGLGVGVRHILSEEESATLLANDTQGTVIFEWRQSEPYNGFDGLLPLSCAVLNNPSSRADDVALFIEGALATIVPEPICDAIQSPNTKRVKRIEGELGLENGDCLRTCLKCRKVIDSNLGCGTCRRALVLTSMAKQTTSGQTKSPTVQTVILSRMVDQEITVEVPSESDRLIKDQMLKATWKPTSILPAHCQAAPITKSCRGGDGGERNDSNNLEIEEGKEPDGNSDISVEEDTILESGGARSNMPSSINMEIAALQTKAVFIACAGMLFAAKRRDPLALFARRTRETLDAVDIPNGITHPTNLLAIQSSLITNGYGDLNTFTKDLYILTRNALASYPVGSTEHDTAQTILDLITVMEKRAQCWLDTLPQAHTSDSGSKEKEECEAVFKELQNHWSEDININILEHECWLRQQLELDFVRTAENELAYYGCLAIRRATTAAEQSLAPYTNNLGMFSVVPKRSHLDDQALRDHVDFRVFECTNRRLKLRDAPTSREADVMNIIRTIQSRRAQRRTTTLNRGCSRFNTIEDQVELSKFDSLTVVLRQEEVATRDRVDSSRFLLTTGMGSQKMCRSMTSKDSGLSEGVGACESTFVSVRKSCIHGFGLFANKNFLEGEVICDLLGVGISKNDGDQMTSTRRCNCHLDHNITLQSTQEVGYCRFINHSCHPNSSYKVVPTSDQEAHLMHLRIVAEKPIAINDEITCCYPIATESLAGRISCLCPSKTCRGFVNWVCPERRDSMEYLDEPIKDLT